VLLSHLPEGAHLPAARVAQCYDLPTAYLAKHLQALARAGILTSAPGRTGGFRLARPAEDVSVLEIVDAVATPPLFACAEIRRRGVVAAPDGAYDRRCGIASVMARAERAWRAELAATTLADLARTMSASTPVDVRPRVRAWLEEVAR
jgi:Rrf2 family protein